MRQLSVHAISMGLLLAASCTPQAQEQVLLPGMIGVQAPTGAHVLNDCGPLIIDGNDLEMKVGCAYFLDETAPDSDGGFMTVSMEATGDWIKAMDAAGWEFAHLAVIEHYFERPRPGSDCSDVAVMISLQGEELKALVESDKANGVYEGRPWRGYGIPAKLQEACGDARKLN